MRVEFHARARDIEAGVRNVERNLDLVSRNRQDGLSYALLVRLLRNSTSLAPRLHS